MKQNSNRNFKNREHEPTRLFACFFKGDCFPFEWIESNTFHCLYSKFAQTIIQCLSWTIVKKSWIAQEKGKRGTQTHVTDVQKGFQHQLELLHVFQTDVVNINNNCYICFERNATSLDHIFKVFVVRNKGRLSGNLRGHIYSPWTLSQPFQARVWVLLDGRLLGLVLVASTWRIQQND